MSVLDTCDAGMVTLDRHADAEQGGSAVETLAAVYAEIGRQDEQWGVQDACRARVTREAS